FAFPVPSSRHRPGKTPYAAGTSRFGALFTSRLWGLQGKETTMRTALLMGTAAALALMATAAARAETVYVTDPDAVVAPGTVYATEPDYVVQDRYQDRSYVVVAPPRQRVIVVPQRE